MLSWLENDLGFKIKDFTPACSDASFRRYFRVVHQQGRHVVMDAPPERENTDSFIHIAKLLIDAGLRAPVIHHIEARQGFLVLEDFGETTFFAALNVQNMAPLYHQALENLYQMQSAIPSVASKLLAAYDRAFLARELDIFYQWFLQEKLNLEIPEDLREQLNTLLIDSALEQPQTFVHRDYHCRNLMLLDNQALGILDFQDAVYGPITYDLASLLKDCYITLPQPLLDELLHRHYQKLADGGFPEVDYPAFKQWFELMAMQRHLKAIGIFSRLDIRDQKPAYLKDIPRTLEYVRQISERFKPLQPFSQYLHHTVLPRYQEIQ